MSPMNFETFPRKAGGDWEMIRDSYSQIRYRQAGHPEWILLGPVGVATLNLIDFHAE